MFRYITLPLLTPVILVAVLVRTMDAFKSFDIFFATTMGGPGTSSEIVSLLAYKMGFRCPPQRAGIDRDGIPVLVAVIRTC